MADTKTPYQVLRETSNGLCVDCFRTAAQARAEVDAINGTRATRKHGMRAIYVGHIARVGDVWARLVAEGRVWTRASGIRAHDLAKAAS